MEYLTIVYYDILPLITLAFLGYELDKHFHMDIRTYRVITDWIMLPCFAFFSLYTYIPGKEDLAAVGLFILLTAAAGLMGSLFSGKLAETEGMRRALRAASAFTDVENIGIVFILLVFTHIPYLADEDSVAQYLGEVRSILVLIVIMSMIMRRLAGRNLDFMMNHGLVSRFLSIFKMPSLYGALLGTGMALAHVNITHTFLWPVLQHYNSAFIIMVSITAGIILNRMPWNKPNVSAMAALIFRFTVWPLVSWMLIAWSGLFTPLVSQVVFMVSFIPAVVVLGYYTEDLAHPDSFTAHTVTAGTLMGILLCPLGVVLAGWLFPLA